MKLITKEIGRALELAYRRSGETGESGTEVLAKFFTPWAGATWYVTEGCPVDVDGEPCPMGQEVDWHLFGFCDLGDRECAELGYVMLSDLQGLKGPFGLRVERDIRYSATLAEVLERYGRAA